MLFAEITFSSDDVDDQPRVFRALGRSVTLYGGETKTLKIPVSGNGETVEIEELTLSGELIEKTAMTVTLPQ